MSSDKPPSCLLDYLRLATAHLEAKGIASGRLDAELLLAKATGLTRLELYTNYDRPLAPAEVDDYRELIRRRARREPVAYITGSREFWSLEFAVDRRVLVPRPETETLVEAAVEAAHARNTNGSGEQRPLRILDIGTGCGAVAVALAVELPAARIVATDVSAAVLEVAPGNAERHGTAQRIDFRHGSLFQPLADDERFGVIVSNPPYCREQEFETLEPEVRSWEPLSALVSGSDGMAVTRCLIEGAPERLEEGGRLLVEVGTQADEVRREFERRGWAELRVHHDLAGRDRVVAATKPAA